MALCFFLRGAGLRACVDRRDGVRAAHTPSTRLRVITRLAIPPARLRSYTKDILILSTEKTQMHARRSTSTGRREQNYWDSSFRSPVSSPFM